MIKFYDGSKVEIEHPRQALYAFLIAAIDSTGKPIYPVKADWFYTPTSWQALDEAQKDYGNCHIAKSAIYDDLINACENNA
jgi:hypothetical protein